MTKLLRHEMKERNEFKAKLEQALKDLKFARAPVVSEEMELSAIAAHDAHVKS
jgi:hypothetical protein